MYKQYKEAWRELTASGSPFAIEEIDVRGVRIKTYAAAPPSLREVWLASAAFADNDYLVYQDERWTYAEAHRDVAAIANWLVSEGVGAGDRVAIAMRNYPEWLQAYWATVSIGATVVGLNAWWIGPEMVYGLNDATPKVVICDQERLLRLIEHRHEIPELVVTGVRLPKGTPDGVVPWDTVIGFGGGLPDAQIDPDSDACIFYTSGTTGAPKGAQLTHRGCVSNVMSLAFSATLSRRLTEKLSGEPVPDPPPGAALITTPLFHVTANNCVAQGTTLGGGKLVHMYRWDAGEALRLIERERITAMSGVPVMARELISHPDFASTDTSSLQTLGGGGAQLQPDLVGKIDEAAKSARPNTGYGMTETCGIITSIGGDVFVDRPDSAGPAMPCYDAKCVDTEGNALPSGAVGELWVKGAQVIRGYLNRPEATAEAITDGWFHTGDVARIDEDGFIYIVDRLKDMVLRGGENVYCAEVESAVFEHPDVVECAVFGVPDDRLGEEVGAAVVLRSGAEVAADSLRGHCASLISAHKIPRFIWFIDHALPRNANGKFVKSELRKTLAITDAA